MSRYRVEVVEVTSRPHPNADSLVVVDIWGYTCVVRGAEFPPGRTALAAYIPPESLVPVARPEFAFLKDKANAEGQARIKVVRLRGTVSQGLLIPARPGWSLGQDVAEELGATHYEPPLPLSTGGEDETPPPGKRPKFDVEHWRRYRGLLVPGEEVLVSEKVHGTNARYCFVDGRMRCGSHANWKKFNPVLSVYWRALESNPEVRDFCIAHEDLTVYAEVYGQVQDLKYGAGRNEVRIVVFDLFCEEGWVPALEARELGPGLPWVPTVYRGAYDPARVEAMAEGKSLMPGADHIREGIVVKPLIERSDADIGRVCLKIIGNAYLARAE